MLSGVKGNLEDLYNRILAEPLTAALTSMPATAGDIVLLVDALDEMHEGAGRVQLLSLMGKGMQGLPARVRFIFTSRPEEDIVAHFKQLKPYTIDKQDEKQRADLRLYAEEHLVRQTDLRTAEPAEVAAVVEEALERADGVFLALRLVATAIKTKQEESGGKVKLTPKDVLDIMRAHKNLVDGTYTETLQRVRMRLKEAAGDDTEMDKDLALVLTQILATLLAARQPLLWGDVHALFGGQVRRSESLTARLLSALSLLFSASNATSPVEPLHKTVVDFLRDKTRSVGHYVDEREGHAALAMATFRVLREHGLLPQEGQRPKVVEPAEIEGLSTVQYVLRHGHAHLAVCAAAAGKEGAPAGCHDALLNWQEEFLEPRKPLEPGVPESKHYKLSSQSATTTFGAWLLLTAHTAGRKRALVKELMELDAVLKVDTSGLGMLSKLLREVMQGYGTRWAPQNTLSSSVMYFVSNTVLPGYLHRSLGSQYMADAVRRVPPFLTIPGVVSAGSCQQVITGHSDFVLFVAYSPDGRQIVSGSYDKTVRVWDAQTGEVLHTLEGHGSCVTCVAFSPDGRQIVSGGWDKTVRVWDAQTGEVLQTFEGHGNFVSSVAYSSGGQQIVSGSNDKTLRIWNAQTGEALHTLNGHSSSVFSVAYSPDGQRIVSGSGDNTVRVWDVQIGEAIHILKEHRNYVHSVSYSPDRRRIVSGSYDHTVRVWDAQTGDALHTFEGHIDWVYSVAFSPDGRRIVSGSRDKTVCIWDVQAGKVLYTLEGHSEHVNSVVYSPDGRIVSGSDDKTMRVWDAQTSDVLQTLEGHNNYITSVAYSPDGRRIVSGSWDKTVRILDAQTGEILLTLEGSGGYVTSVAFSPDGRQIVSGSWDKTVRVWDARTGENLRTLEGHIDGINSVAYSPDGQQIVSGGFDRAVSVWNSQTDGRPRNFQGFNNTILSVAYSPDGQQVVSGNKDNTVRVWNPQTGEALHRALQGHSDSVNSVAYSPDGQQIVSGSDDSTIRVWNVQTGESIRILKGHNDPVGSVAYSPNGRWIVSGSNDRTVRVWDAQTGEVLHTLEGHTNSVSSVAYSFDGRRIVSGSWDKTVRVWEGNFDNPEQRPGKPRMIKNAASKSGCCLLL